MTLEQFRDAKAHAAKVLNTESTLDPSPQHAPCRYLVRELAVKITELADDIEALLAAMEHPEAAQDA